ncbi:TIGR01777 family protein [Panacibacter ginsenosidivorans]|uniref:TIGR01777 family protein n=1 Tax=Panacibacter ginsenosidivorans TaxID=1813871 RepID=A0A5B8VC74_9BACT|nr:TIGR01777 family oxidoreductase [Panacibacter ginsenosidivorans]QEC68531.1 TIGR01777 family protein [Panacibacter ginsenosidivorans]
MKIIIAGGTGFIGRYVAEYFGEKNEVVILTRNISTSINNAFKDFCIADNLKSNIRLVQWNGEDNGDWCKEIESSDIIINLAGKLVNCRYTETNKKEIFDSRTKTTKALGEAIKKCVMPPKLWINAASATIYRHATDRPQDEYNGEIQNDFSVQVCKLWEKTFFDQQTPFTRKVTLRMAVTLADGGVMIPYINLCKFGLGGKQGNGKQMYSWVHIEDICRAINFISQHSELEGIFNVCSPNPVTNETFMRSLRKKTGNSIGFPAGKLLLKIGATLIGTETELLLKSRWVLPAKLLQNGFAFKYNNIDEAFENIIANLPRKRYHL